MPTPSYEQYFQELAKQPPESICKRAGCDYDTVQNCFHLNMWGQEHAIYPNESRIDRVGKNTLDRDNYNYLFIIQYLLNAKEIEVKDEWISEKDIPGGPTFFRGPHTVPTNLISDRFENHLEGFKRCCKELYGKPIDMGDAAFKFYITPRIPVVVLYWIGDEDFPAEAKILYDKTIIDHLATDIIFALAVLVCNRLGKK